jgi:hypothetical protein
MDSGCSGLNNRVPGPVLVLEVAGAAVALGLRAFDLAILGRGVLTVLLAAALVTLLLWVTFDLDRQPAASSAFPQRLSPTCGP